MNGKKLLIEIQLVEESNQKTTREIINDIYTDIAEGKCIIPWCQSVLMVAKIDEFG